MNNPYLLFAIFLNKGSALCHDWLVLQLNCAELGDCISEGDRTRCDWQVLLSKKERSGWIGTSGRFDPFYRRSHSQKGQKGQREGQWVLA